MTRRFWIDLLERAIKTFVQTAVASTALGKGLSDTDWLTILDVAGLATLLSVLMSLGSIRLGDPGTASAVRLDPADNPDDQP